MVLCCIQRINAWELRQGELLVDGRCSWPASDERPDKSIIISSSLDLLLVAYFYGMILSQWSSIFLVCALNVKYLVMAALVPQQQLGEGVFLALLRSSAFRQDPTFALTVALGWGSLCSNPFILCVSLIFVCAFFKPAYGESRPFRCQHRFHLKALFWFFFFPWKHCWFITVQNGSHCVFLDLKDPEA